MSDVSKLGVVGPQAAILVRSIVVPRSITAGTSVKSGGAPAAPANSLGTPRRLHFFLVFGVHHEADESTKGFAPGGGRAHWRQWPALIKRLIAQRHCRLALSGAVDPATGQPIQPPAEKLAIHWDEPRDLHLPGYGAWTERDAIAAWKSLILPTLDGDVMSQSLRTKAPLRRCLEGNNIAAPVLLANPAVASDWTPSRSLHAVDLAALGVAHLNARFWSDPQLDAEGLYSVLQWSCDNQGDRYLMLLQDLDNRLGMFQEQVGEELETRIGFIWPEERAEGLVGRNLRIALQKHITELKQEQQVAVSKQQKLAFPALSKLAATDTRLAFLASSLHSRNVWYEVGRDETRRMNRAIESGRNRWMPGGATPATGLATDDRHAVRAKVDLTNPSFEELIARLQNHPGLRRRLYLTVKCWVDLPAAWDDVTAAEGLAQLQVDWAGAGGSGPSPFEGTASATRFQFDRGDATGGRGFFRAKPRHEHFLESPGQPLNPLDLWRQYHVLPTTWYMTTQQDLGVGAARAPQNLDTPPIAQIDDAQRVDALAKTVVDHRVNAIHFYSTPPIVTAAAASASESAAPEDESLARKMRAFDNSAESLVRRLQEQRTVSTVQAAGAAAPASEEDALHAEDLMLGHTVYVRCEGRGGFGPWRSLNRRCVNVTPGQSGSARAAIGTSWSFVEDGFVTSTSTTLARPLVGEIVEVLPRLAVRMRAGSTRRVELSDGFKLRPLGVDNKRTQARKIKLQYETGLPSSGSDFTDEEAASIRLTSRLRGNFRAAVTDRDIQKGMYALVTPSDVIRDEVSEDAKAAEVVLSPVFAREDKQDLILTAVTEMDLPSKRLPVLVRPESTQYLDVLGQPASEAKLLDLTSRFLVQGQRRYFVDAAPTIEGAEAEEADTLSGELIRMELLEEGSAAPHHVLLELTLLDGKHVSIVAPEEATFEVADGYPRRSVRDLEAGEFLVVHVDDEPGPYRDWRKPQTEGSATEVRMTAGLRGKLRKADACAPLRTLLNGSTTYRPFQVVTPSGLVREFWHYALGDSPLYTSKDEMIRAAGCPVIDADALLQIDPGANDAATDSSEAESEPFTGLVSELIAKWSGWSLAVKQPGKTFPPAAVTTPGMPFVLKSYLPDVTQLSGTEHDAWLQPALRFDRRYQFCLRRADLAGNHDWDEPPLPATLGASAVSKLKPALAYTLPNAYQTLAPIFLGEMSSLKGTFVRADRPTPPLMAFRPDRPETMPQSDRSGIPVGRSPAPPSLPVSSGLEAVVANSAELVLFTDVFNHEHKQESAPKLNECYIVPPPAGVDTVMLHGALDAQQSAGAVGRTIYAHESFHDDGIKALKKSQAGSPCNLNYFGDPLASRVKIALDCRGTTYDCLAGVVDGHAVASFYTTWPCVRRIKLKLVGNTVCAGRGTALPPLEECPISMTSTGADRNFAINLPAGGQGSARLCFSDVQGVCDGVEWGSIRLVHAVNSPCTPPKWTRLEEIVSETTQVDADQPRLIVGEFDLHVPTTGGYRVFAYWNEVWDESLPAQFRLATAHAQIAGGQLQSVDVEDAGFGYGRGASAVFDWHPGKIPAKLPVLQVVMEGEGVKEVLVISGGDGVQSDSIRRLRLVRQPPLHRRAVARAKIRGGRVVNVKVDEVQRGGWYQSAPWVVVHDLQGLGSGATCKAFLNECGGVSEVKVCCPGQGYSGDVEIRFYTHMHSFHDHSEPVEYDPDNPNVPTSQPVRLEKAFDASARDLDFVIEAESRFLPYLHPYCCCCDACDNPTKATAGDAAKAEACYRHVPRYSPPATVSLHSLAPPQKPDVDYLVPSFSWQVRAPEAMPLIEADAYFRNRHAGRLIVDREANLRAYLHRRWHIRGDEQLAIIVFPSSLHSIRADGEAAVAKALDEGADNPAARLDSSIVQDVTSKPEHQFRYKRFFIPPEYRRFVSMWGYDPAWNESALPPLALSHLTNRRRTIETAILSGLSASLCGDAAGQAQQQAPVEARRIWAALHDVQYDAPKERWYADVRVDLADGFKSLATNPFVQLAIATYQDCGLRGSRLSEIVQCDFFKLVGDRRLDVVRHGSRRFSIRLSGAFETNGAAASAGNRLPLPVRRIVARVQARDRRLPFELEVQQVPENFSRLPQAASETQSLATVLNVLEVQLQPDAAGREYYGEVAWAPPDATFMKHRQLVLEVIESEYFPTSDEAQMSNFSDAFAMVNERLCTSWTKYYAAIQI